MFGQYLKQVNPEASEAALDINTWTFQALQNAVYDFQDREIKKLQDEKELELILPGSRKKSFKDTADVDHDNNDGFQMPPTNVFHRKATSIVPKTTRAKKFGSYQSPFGDPYTH